MRHLDLIPIAAWIAMHCRRKSIAPRALSGCVCTALFMLRGEGTPDRAPWSLAAIYPSTTHSSCRVAGHYIYIFIYIYIYIYVYRNMIHGINWVGTSVALCFETIMGRLWHWDCFRTVLDLFGTVLRLFRDGVSTFLEMF